MKPKRVLGTAALGLATVALVAGCSSSSGSGFNEQTQDAKSQSSVRFGSRAKIPADFPTAAVPLPDVGRLQAVVTGKNLKNRFYTLTYALGGTAGVAAGRAYSDRLNRAGYTIRNPQRLSGTDGGLMTFEAVGKQWDLSVVSGKSGGEPQSMSVQIATHGTLTDLDELSGIDNGLQNSASTDNPDGGATTTTTIDPLAG